MRKGRRGEKKRIKKEEAKNTNRGTAKGGNPRAGRF